jgi:hypothetical protein
MKSQQLKKEPNSDEREAAGMTKPRGTFAGRIELIVRTRSGAVRLPSASPQFRRFLARQGLR